MSSRGISEIVLIVGDVDRATQFYRDVVGLELESSSEDWAWFWAGEAGARRRIALHRGSLMFEEHSPFPKGERFGRVHFAFEIDRDRLEGRVERVKSSGLDVYGPVELDWMRARSYYFYDPDGNLLEFWSPDPDASPAADNSGSDPR